MRSGEQIPRDRRLIFYWICQIVGWGLFAASGLLLAILYRTSTTSLMFYYMIAAPSGIAGSHLLRRELKRRHWFRLPISALLPRAAVGTILAGTFSWLIMFAVTLWPFRFATWSTLQGSVLIVTWWNWQFVMVLWTALYGAAHYIRNLRRTELERLQLEVTASDAQLRLLRSQVNPHFLFNCLNSLRALIVEEPAKAQAMVTQLSNIMRYSLQAGKTETVPLAHELEAVRDYLSLEGIRFEERLQTRFEIDKEALAVEVPPMLLQNLVENAVKYGISRLPQGGEVSIEARVAAGIMALTVRNSGQLVKSSESTGIGISNTRDRLRLLYGEAASLVLENCGPELVEARVLLPAVRTAERIYARADRG